MKRVCKGNEPVILTSYRKSVPKSTWEQMKDDSFFKGKDAYVDCRTKIAQEQEEMCAYCEIHINNNPSNTVTTWRVEHFHPKSDTTSSHNWALDWNNMLGVCHGGSQKYVEGSDQYLEPLKKNKSCDTYKNEMIQAGKLPEKCEGWILNPLQLQANLNLFELDKSTGKFEPHVENCESDRQVQVIENNFGTLEKFVQNTIDMLNLNCDRLCRARLQIIRSIKRDQKQQRKNGFTQEQGLNNLAKKYFSYSKKQFFTTFRLYLGATAEEYLSSLNYDV